MTAIQIAAVLHLVVTTVGMFGNFNIIWATVRKSNLRSTCNILIAATAAADFLHEISKFNFAYFVFARDGMADLSTCLAFQFVPMLGCSMGGALLVAIGLDRLLSVAAAGVYGRLNRRLYAGAVLALVAALSAGMNAAAVADAAAHPNTTVLCVVVQGFHSYSMRLFSATLVLENAVALVVYGTLSWFIRAKISKASKRSQQVLNSIAVIGLLVISGWMITFGLLFTVGRFYPEHLQSFTVINGFPVGISIALNYPVYFYMSKDYRNAFLEQLHIMTQLNRFRAGNSSVIKTVSIAANNPVNK